LKELAVARAKARVVKDSFDEEARDLIYHIDMHERRSHVEEDAGAISMGGLVSENESLMDARSVSGASTRSTGRRSYKEDGFGGISPYRKERMASFRKHHFYSEDKNLVRHYPKRHRVGKVTRVMRDAELHWTAKEVHTPHPNPPSSFST